MIAGYGAAFLVILNSATRCRSSQGRPQSLGWTRPWLRDPQAVDRWTWLAIVAHTQLRLALPVVVDQCKPWEKTTRTGTALTPTRVRH